jgi:hypothetical protein
MSVVTKEDLYRLVDELPESERVTARRVLQGLVALGHVEPLYTIETAPLDDELETEEERAAVAEARASSARGEVVSHDAIRREFGL